MGFFGGRGWGYWWVVFFFVILRFFNYKPSYEEVFFEMINVIWPHCVLKMKINNSANHQHSQQRYKPFLYYKSKLYAQKLRQNAYESLDLRLEHAYKCGGIKPTNRTSKVPTRDIHRHYHWLNRRRQMYIFAWS